MIQVTPTPLNSLRCCTKRPDNHFAFHSLQSTLCKTFCGRSSLLAQIRRLISPLETETVTGPDILLLLMQTRRMLLHQTEKKIILILYLKYLTKISFIPHITVFMIPRIMYFSHLVVVITFIKAEHFYSIC